MMLVERMRIVPATRGCWHLIYTKAQQDEVVQLNFERQSYECYLPRLRIERLRRRKRDLLLDPPFPRYLFARLDGRRDW